MGQMLRWTVLKACRELGRARTPEDKMFSFDKEMSREIQVSHGKFVVINAWFCIDSIGIREGIYEQVAGRTVSKSPEVFI